MVRGGKGPRFCNFGKQENRRADWSGSFAARLPVHSKNQDP